MAAKSKKAANTSSQIRKHPLPAITEKFATQIKK